MIEVARVHFQHITAVEIFVVGVEQIHLSALVEADEARLYRAAVGEDSHRVVMPRVECDDGRGSDFHPFSVGRFRNGEADLGVCPILFVAAAVRHQIGIIGSSIRKAPPDDVRAEYAL